MRTRTDLTPDEAEALRCLAADRIMTRLKNKRLRRCLTEGEWQLLMTYPAPVPIQNLLQKLAAYHRFLPADSICPTCGRSRNEASDV